MPLMMRCCEQTQSLDSGKIKAISAINTDSLKAELQLYKTLDVEQATNRSVCA